MGVWREVYEKMLEDLKSPAFRRFGSYSIAGRSFSYRSIDEFKKLLDWVGQQADLEEGLVPYKARKSIINGGRGWS